MAWYNSSWTRRKAVTLTGGASGGQTDYQMKIVVPYDSDMQADFDDLRFTKLDGTTLLDAWLENYTASTSATVIVETNTPSNTVDADIYMYYGNSGASDYWDGSGTFLFYEDSESALSGWSASANRGTTPYEGTYNLETSNADHHPVHDITENSFCLEAKVKQSSRAGLMIRCNQSPEPSGVSGVGYLLFNKNDGNIYIYEEGVGYIDTETATNPTTDWYNWKFVASGSYLKGKYWADNTSEPAWMIEHSDGTIGSGGLGIYGYSSINKYDCIRASKYVSSPATYSIGSEEIAPGWSNKIIGVSSPGKVISVLSANIGKIIGV